MSEEHTITGLLPVQGSTVDSEEIIKQLVELYKAASNPHHAERILLLIETVVKTASMSEAFVR